MGLRLKKTSESPGLKFTHPETGYLQQAWDMGTLMNSITRYRLDNQLPSLTQDEVEDKVCQSLPPGWCRYTDGGQPQDFANMVLGWSDVLHGTLALGEIAARRAASTLVPSWSPFVEQAEADRRAAICASCYAKVPVGGCLSCAEYIGKAQAVIGDRHTAHDSQLSAQACGVCHCSASVQVHIKSSILARGIDDAMQAKFTAIPHCWKSRLTDEPESVTPTP